MKDTTLKQAITTILAFALAVPAVAQTAGAPNTSQAARPAATPQMKLVRHGMQASAKGPAANFTGAVRVDPLFGANPPSRSTGAYVTFEPGARSAWHSHPLGQTLVVTAGIGRVQQWGGAVLEIRPGDVVWTPPNVKHWHGATPSTAMTHLAISEREEGKAVAWMEKVSDAQYGR